MKPHKILLTAALCTIAALSANAKIKLPAVIGDNMVLQQQTDAAIWGWAEPGRKVTIKNSWSKAKTVVTADPETGKWLARVATPAAGGPYTMTISDGDKLTINNILIGEVWFCSGQSNMELPVKGYGSQPAEGGADAILRAKPSRELRICNVQRNSQTSVVEDCTASWNLSDPGTVSNTSAVAYFFADRLQGTLDVPVGIIVSCWGGSSIETWLDRKTIESQFGSEFTLGHLDGTAPIKVDNQDPCLLFNGQVNPLIPYTFKGMIWYQGCTNRPNPEQYTRLQTAYAKMMRELFNVPDAPFFFVQIAPYKYDNGRKTHNGYFNEAQQATLKTIPNSGMVTTVDIGEYGTIHPKKKREVGDRLAMLALQHTYGYWQIDADAPTYDSVLFEKGVARVTFNCGWEGLSPMGADIPGFEIAGADHVWKPARARFHQAKVITVWSNEVPEPVAVRYCFRNWCVGGLYNNYGIPAAPFRTDDWPLDENDWK